MHRKRGQIAPAIIRVAVDIVVAIAEYRAVLDRYSLVVARNDRMADADDAAQLSFEPDIIVAGDEVAHLNVVVEDSESSGNSNVGLLSVGHSSVATSASSVEAPPQATASRATLHYSYLSGAYGELETPIVE